MKYILMFLSIFCISLSSICCTFHTSFFNKINKKFKGQNLLVSPLSIYQILNLKANGAKGNTQKEMLKILGSESFSELNEINFDLSKH